MKMANMTFAVPEDLHKIMKKHKEVKWSEVARQAIRLHAKKLELMDKLVSKSKLTEKDVKEISDKIKKEIAKEHGLIR
jgi:polyhydroxyalkanoate synthesis regulator phasin